MTKATRVLSTPPLNSSSIQSTNPPLEARPESVDSFSHHPAIGQPESENLTGDSPKPVEGLSRRAALAGLAMLPAVVAMPVLDTAPAEVVAKFERLLEEYYARRAAWGPRLEQAHAETDRIFGEEWDGGDAEHRGRVFSEACIRLEVNNAGDQMHAVGEEMKPLAQAIVALPTASLEALRAKTLVALWEVAPLCASDTEYHFGDAYPFQLLFSAVAEFCGLTKKINATGYTLPELPDLFSPSCEDDEEEV
jgi:hypothetical protein